MDEADHPERSSDMKRYYRERAPVYERVYDYHERQDDLRYLERTLPARFDDLRVLEIAAGTGYWTRCLAGSARSIMATDVTAAALARIGDVPDSVEVRSADAYRLGALGRTFNGAFAGLWFSHVPIERRQEFLDSLHSVLEPGARVIMLDNSRAQCERLPVTHTDDRGNTYQDRTADNGSVHRVLKNFPDEAELRALVADGTEVRFQALEHFWLFEYRREKRV